MERGPVLPCRHHSRPEGRGRAPPSPFVITSVYATLACMRTCVRQKGVRVAKRQHEFCDPIHDFVRVDSDERKVIDSPPLQRLRHIHQLAMTFLVYPGATHRRFEHSLGTMELAGRVYDAVTGPSETRDYVREVFPDVDYEEKRLYWRRVVRLAALCHDIGHLPFSHAAEHELLPDGWSHERLSMQLILSHLSCLFDAMTPPVKADHVAKVAVGPKKAKDVPFSAWERILSEIIVGDAFGVDRMDYLLRDSLHVGVPYGNFGHHRLIDTLRILPFSADKSSNVPSLGVELGGLQSAEALLMSRYFMYSQVYYHRVRMIYDQHLIDFLKNWLKDGQFSTDTSSHLLMTDNEVTAGILDVARNTRMPGHKWAKRLANREHFRVLYSRPPQNVERDCKATVKDTEATVKNLKAATQVRKAAEEQYGPSKIKYAHRHDKGGEVDFPVLMYDGSIASSKAVSEILGQLPSITKEYVYADNDILRKAEIWFKENRDQLLEMESEEREDS